VKRSSYLVLFVPPHTNSTDGHTGPDFWNWGQQTLVLLETEVSNVLTKVQFQNGCTLTTDAADSSKMSAII